MRFVPVISGLAPFDQAAHEFMSSLRSGEPITLEVVHDRDMFEHRKIFAQINELAKAIGTDPERLRAELLFETGNYQHLGEMFGKTMIAVNSMSRNAMKDPELHAFWDEAKEVIRTKMLSRIDNIAERERLARSLSLQEA